MRAYKNGGSGGGGSGAAGRSPFQGNWQNQEYKAGDIVIYGEPTNSWQAMTDLAVDAGSPYENGAWHKLDGAGLVQRGTWAISTPYYVDNVVTRKNSTYHCISPVAGSEDPPENNAGQWELWARGFYDRGDWNDEETYWVGEVVRRLGRVYVCTIDSTNGDYVPGRDSESNWRLWLEGTPSYKGPWDSGTAYIVGDSVSQVVDAITRFYTCIADTTNEDPTYTPASWQSMQWIPRGEYAPVLAIRDDVFTYQGATWRCKEVTEDAPSVGTYWEVLAANGFSVKGLYDSGTTYNKGEIVYDDGTRGADSAVKYFLSVVDANVGESLDNQAFWICITKPNVGEEGTSWGSQGSLGGEGTYDVASDLPPMRAGVSAYIVANKGEAWLGDLIINGTIVISTAGADDSGKAFNYNVAFRLV